MPSLKRHEGYLLIDHQASPGLSEADIDPAWRGKEVHAVPEGKKLEMGSFTCHHCQGLVIMSPARKRAPNYCPKCDHYICDKCEQRRHASGGECIPMKKVLDELQEQNARREQLGIEASPILLP